MNIQTYNQIAAMLPDLVSSSRKGKNDGLVRAKDIISELSEEEVHGEVAMSLDWLYQSLKMLYKQVFNKPLKFDSSFADDIPF
jgi:hypothetical protein